MATVHMSDSEVTKNFAAVLENVRNGFDVVVEQDHQPVATISATIPKGRLLSESIAIAEAREKEQGAETPMDADYAADLEDIVRSRKPRHSSAWD